MSESATHSIPLDTAVEMTALYRKNRPDNFPVCESFRLDEVQKLLATPGAAYLRVYYGMKADKTVHAILVAADKDGADILPASASKDPGLLKDDGDPPILEDSIRCPDECPPPSPLN